MRKITTTIALSLIAIAHPALAQDKPVQNVTASDKPSESFVKLFRKMDAEMTANEAYRIAMAVKHARVRH